MKTKFLWLTLITSAALIGQAHAGDRHNNGSGGGRGVGPRGSISSRAGHYRPASGRSYGGMRSSDMSSSPNHSTAFRQRYGYSGPSSLSRPDRFSTQRFSGADHSSRFNNSERSFQGENGNFARGNGSMPNRAARTNQSRQGNRLRSNWQSHVFARHSADWHRDWDRHEDHWWHGHRVVFIGGSWVVFDFGFSPWWPWPYWYPYDYYGSPYGYGYPYGYYSYPNGYYGEPSGDDQGYSYDDSNSYQGGEAYYNPNTGEAYEDGGSDVTAMQERLARQGYYHGQIDGIFGPETRRALAAYRRDHHEAMNSPRDGQGEEPLTYDQ